MKPIILTMTAFGPFANTQTIDFRELRDRSFFLIHGPTGAGKTTILDAICFALYGEPSGMRTAKQMRSQHTKTNLLTEVTFDFEFGQNRYRVKRRPEQEIPRERGEGTRSISQTAILWKREFAQPDSEEGTVIASKPREVKEQIEGLFHFKREEFLQVMMLPQDEFRELLTADSVDRERIFKTLFQTKLFESIEQRLKETANRIKEDASKLEDRRSQVLLIAHAENEGELQGNLEQVRQRLAEIKAVLNTLKQEEHSALDLLNRGKDDTRKIAEAEVADTELRQLESLQPTIQLCGRDLARARQAADLVGAEKAKSDNQRIADDAVQKRDEATLAYQHELENQKKASEALHIEEEREGERQSARQELDRLGLLRSKVIELAKSQEDVRSADAVVTEAERALKKAQALKLSLQQQLHRNQTAIIAAQDAARQLDALRFSERDARRAYELQKRLVELHQQHVSAREKESAFENQVTDMAQKLAQSRKEEENIQDTLFVGQAAVLARRLVDGTPCPVCGSTHHPRVAKAEMPIPSEKDLKAKHSVVEQLDKSLENVRNELSKHNEVLVKIKADIESAAEQLGDQKDKPLKSLEEHVKNSRNALIDAEAQAMQATELSREQSEIDRELADSENVLSQSEKRLQEVINLRTAALTRVDERERDVPSNLRDLTVLDQIQLAASHKVQLIENTLTTARNNGSRANELLAAAKSKFDEHTKFALSASARAVDSSRKFTESIHASGFGDEDEYQKSKRSSEQINSLEQQISEYAQRLHAARERTVRAQKESEGLKRPDLSVLESLWMQAKKNVEGVISEEASKQHELANLEDWLSNLGRLSTELEQQEKRYAVIGRIAKVANGENPRNMTFQRFVLAAKLDEVLLEASQRLHTMSETRYILKTADTPIDRRRAAGLDLEVKDTWTDDTRPVKTLSGGESFYTSLALALGLADVVQRYAGGIRLDTIFIDEGFGSLDSEKLDRAIQALEDLREGGRLVGIISHVDSLRERIPTRLEITEGTQGSSAHFILV